MPLNHKKQIDEIMNTYRGKKTSETIQQKIVEMTRNGIDTSIICQRLGVSRYTVYKYGDASEKRGGARESHKYMSHPDVIAFIKETIDREPHETAALLKEIQCKFPAVKAGHNRLAKLTSELGLKKKVVQKQCEFSELDMAARLNFARDYRDLLVQNHVLFVDESAFDTSYAGKRRYAICSEKHVGKVYNNSAARVGKKWPLKFIGAISKVGYLPLFFFDGNLTAVRYTEFIGELVDAYCSKFGCQRCEVVVVEDNAPTHSAFAATQARLLSGYQIVRLPPRSPDFNPIENLWAELKEQVFNDTDYFTSVSNAAGFKQKVSEAWFTVCEKHLSSIMQSVPKRFEKAIELNGQRTEY